MYLDLVDVQNQMLVGWIMHSTVNIWICKIITRHTLCLNLEVFGFFSIQQFNHQYLALHMKCDQAKNIKWISTK